MAVRLTKGEQYNIENEMNCALVILKWDANNSASEYDYDLDVSAFLLGSGDRVTSENDFVFYNNLSDPSGAVKLFGDNTMGGDVGETIMIDFTKIPPAVEKVAIIVTINDADKKKQNFGKVSNAYIRVMRVRDEKDRNGEIVLMFDLQDEYAREQGMIICEIVRKSPGGWRFNALAQGINDGLAEMCDRYGVPVE